MPSAPAKRSPRSPIGTVGNVRGGKPNGTSDQVDTSVREIEHREGSDREDDGGEHGREDRPQALESHDQDQACSPTASEAPTVSVTDRLGERDPSPIRPSASTENPNSLGSWLTRIVSARPFMYPIWVGFDRRSAMKPR